MSNGSPRNVGLYNILALDTVEDVLEDSARQADILGFRNLLDAPVLEALESLAQSDARCAFPSSLASAS
jgi:hypothetical protein